MNFNRPNPDGPFPESFPFPGQRPPFDINRPILDKIIWPIKYGRAQVKILVVTDGATYDTVNGFGLGLMLQDAFNIGTNTDIYLTSIRNTLNLNSFWHIVQTEMAPLLDLKISSLAMPCLSVFTRFGYLVSALQIRIFKVMNLQL